MNESEEIKVEEMPQQHKLTKKQLAEVKRFIKAGHKIDAI